MSEILSRNRIVFDGKALRFIYPHGQTNCHWYLLNPFLSPVTAAPRRIRNFFVDAWDGFQRVRGKKQPEF